MTRTLTVWLLSIVLFISCQRSTVTPDPPPATTPPDSSVTTKPVKTDSGYLLTSVHGCASGTTHFSYDQSNHRYSAVYGINSAGYYDSTRISYNPDGTIATFLQLLSPVDYTGRKMAMTVLTYKANKQIDKIYAKIPAHEFDYTAWQSITPWIGDSTAAISFYDSVSYDTKNRIASTYRRPFYSYVIGSERYYRPGSFSYCRKFSYYIGGGRDSLISKVEGFFIDVQGNETLDGKLDYFLYDSARNPFYEFCPIYGLIDNKTQFISQAFSNLNNYRFDGFLNLSPHNALYSSEDGQVSYTYTSFGMPDKCYRYQNACDWTLRVYAYLPR